MTKTFPIELSEDLHKRLKIAAIHDGVTLHDWIVKTLKEKVENNGTATITPSKREGTNERSRRQVKEN